MTEGKRWSVYFSRGNQHGSLPPMRMLCKDEVEARREFAQHDAVGLGYEVILEARKERDE